MDERNQAMSHGSSYRGSLLSTQRFFHVRRSTGIRKFAVPAFGIDLPNLTKPSTYVQKPVGRGNQ